MSDNIDIAKEWRSKPEAAKEALKELCGNKPHAFIGDFLVFSAIVIGGSRENSGVMHIPSGRWRALKRPFKQAKKEAESMSEDQIRDTIVWLHDV